jgi:hypothetical protein
MNENARIQWFKILPSATPISGRTGFSLDVPGRSISRAEIADLHNLFSFNGSDLSFLGHLVRL